MKLHRTISALILSLLIVLAMLPVSSSYGAEAIDITKLVNLTLNCRYGDKPVQGKIFNAYRLADVDKYGRITPVKDNGYDNFNLGILGKDDEGWRSTAAALESYVLAKNIKADGKAVSDENGVAVFSGLQQGLYLIIDSRLTMGNVNYEPSPFIVQLPMADSDTNSWKYNVTSDVKGEIIPVSPSQPDSQYTDITVTKGWEDNDDEYKVRPSEVRVYLLKEGDVIDQAVLNRENNWKHTWKNLDKRYSYTVAEDIVEYYSPQLEREGYEFALINTYYDSSIEPGPSGDINVPGGSDSPDASGTGSPDSGKLPQTGSMWWPVPVLTAAGLILICAGVMRRRRS